jgi:hypothetical protein
MGGNEVASDAHPIPGRENKDEVSDSKGAEQTDEKKKEGENDSEKPNIGNFFVRRPHPQDLHPSIFHYSNLLCLQRVLSYATSVDWVFMGAATTCSIGAGVVGFSYPLGPFFKLTMRQTLPLMNIVFGQSLIPTTLVETVTHHLPLRAYRTRCRRLQWLLYPGLDGHKGPIPFSCE